MTYLDHLQRPSLNIPLALRNAPDIIIDEQSLRLYLENQAIGDLAHIGHQLRDGLGKKIIEQIHRFDNDLVRIGCCVRSTSRRRWRCASCRLGGRVGRLRVRGRDVGACSCGTGGSRGCSGRNERRGVGFGTEI